MSLRKAINTKCRQCAVDKLDKGTWRQQIQSCTISKCGLHPFRPISGKPLPERLLKHWGLEKQPSGGQK